MEEVTNYDDWKLSSGQDHEKPLCLCDQCEEEIYLGEEGILTIEGDTIHENCFYDYAWKFLSPRRYQ